MPMYEHACRECGHQETVYRAMKDIDDAPRHCKKPMERLISRSMVITDIQPYTTVAADKETKQRVRINSRSQHREFLRKNGYEELGNEKFTPTPKNDKPTEPDVPFDVFN